MRFIDTAIPLFVGLSALAEAQDVDFGKVYSVKPQLKSASNTGSSTSSVNTASTASSIVSVLSSRHAATMVPSGSSSSSSQKSSSSAKASSSSKSSSSAKSSSASKTSAASSRQSSSSAQSSSSKSSSKSSSSVKAPTTLSTQKATSSTKQSSSSTSSKTSSSSAAATNLCPAVNNKDITDSKGKVYTIKCSSDTNVGSFTSKSATNSYTDCMTICDTTSGCVAFSYVGGDNGSGSGTCWMKNSAGSAIAAGKNYVAGFLKSATVNKGKASVSSSKKSSSSSKMATSTKKASSSSAKVSTSVKKVTSTSSKRSTSTSTKSSSTKVKRATATTCSNPNSILYNYAPNPNTPTQFLVDSTLAALSAAQWYPPAGYSTSFTGQFGGLFAPNYLGYQQLSSYNTSACAAYCNARADCNAFNIYFERTPVFIPDDSCPSPNAAATITCALYGSSVDASTATNIGQYRKDFMVVIQGSNGYNLNPAPASVSSFQGPNALDAVAYSSGIYLAQQYFSTYDVTQCSAACTAYTAKSKSTAQSNKASTYSPCNYFNIFNLTLNGQSQMMGCYLFSTSDAQNYDTYRTAKGSDGTVYNLTNSYGYALYPQDKGLTSVTWSAAPTGTGASCASLGKAGDALIDYNTVNYTLGCGYDVQYSNDIGNQTTPDFYSCFAICDSGAYPGCSGFAYLGNTCYFKNLTGSSRTPQLDNYNVDMAWLPASYAGFGASTVAATVTFTTTTIAWTGASTTTVTSINGLQGTIIVETPGKVTAATTTTYVTTAIESGTASTIATQTIAPTGTGKTGTVQVIYPTPATTCGNKGALAGLYSNTFSNLQGTTSYPAFKPESFKTKTPYAIQTASYMGEYNYLNTAPTVYGKALTYAQASVLTLNHVFYLFAGHGTGYYSINLPQADDITLVWIGQNALSGYTRANANMLQTYVQGTPTPVTLAFFLSANTYTPIRVIFGNGAEVGNFQMNMYAPDGTQILGSNAGTNTGMMNPDIVQFPCDTTLGGKFAAFGKET
ncbi:hypothetical protein D6C84_09655 [Aureobasidium pullulans]|uniref:PA14 domain-containing protein n=1 Tax=Aureobasidium pullulans TaxID=5580 RepID=A0A4S9X432_AURPU|nr:hypothetical protein D6C84_09655 [Aureobasidium pullulans]